MFLPRSSLQPMLWGTRRGPTNLVCAEEVPVWSSLGAVKLTTTVMCKLFLSPFDEKKKANMKDCTSVQSTRPFRV